MIRTTSRSFVCSILCCCPRCCYCCCCCCSLKREGQIVDRSFSVIDLALFASVLVQVEWIGIDQLSFLSILQPAGRRKREYNRIEQNRIELNRIQENNYNKDNEIGLQKRERIGLASIYICQFTSFSTIDWISALIFIWDIFSTIQSLV